MSDSQHIIGFLAKIPFFSEVSTGSLEAFGKGLGLQRFYRNETIFSKGDPGESMYAIWKGKVRVHEDEHDYAILGEGECFGEYALLDERPRSASVTALEETELIPIERRHFLRLMKTDSGFSQGILAEMIKRHRELDTIQASLAASRDALEAAHSRVEGLINGAMDAIILFNKSFRITLTNASANLLLDNPDTLQRNVLFFLDEPSAQMLENLVHSGKDGKDSTIGKFLPRPVKVIGSGGGESLNEGTLSSYQHGGDTYYILILRNIEARLRAEDKIELLTHKADYLEEELRELTGSYGIIGEDRSMQAVIRSVEQVAATGATVLIQGETGTGKELVARAIHEASDRHDKPMIRVNCGAIPANLIESELFGHEKGSFTGAVASRKGRFLLADGGSIFLDEIGEMPLELQPKLLRVIQEGEFDPIGSSKTVKVDVRIIAATHRDLPALAGEGKFREDLYYRLNVFPVEVPPLRNRGKDILLIAREMIQRFASKLNKLPVTIDVQDEQLFLNHDWPGNVRELQNLVERGVIVSRNGKLNWETILPGGGPKAAGPSVEKSETVLTAEQLQALERENILKALRRTSWKVSGADGAAALLKLPPTTLASKIKALGIERPV